MNSTISSISLLLGCTGSPPGTTTGDTSGSEVVLGSQDSLHGKWTERLGKSLAFLPDGRLLIGAPSYLIGDPNDQADDTAWVTSATEGLLDYRDYDPSLSTVLQDPWAEYQDFPNLASASNGFGHTVLPAGDLDGDSIDDIAVSEQPNGPTYRGQWSVLVGPDYAVGFPLAYLPLTGEGAPCGDLDGDGIAELCTSDGVYFGPLLEDAAPQLSWTAEDPHLAAIDLDGDGTMGLLVSDAALHAVHHLATAPRAGEVALSDIATATWTAPSGHATALAAGDLDGDGSPELVIGWSDDGTDEVRISSPSSGASPLQGAAATLPVRAEALAVGDFDGDGQDDLAVGGAGEVTVWLGPLTVGPKDLDEAAVRYVSEQSPDNGFGSALAAADADGDGRDDLAIGAPDDLQPGTYFDPAAGRVWRLLGAGL